MKSIYQILILSIVMGVITFLLPENILPSDRLFYYMSIALNTILAIIFIKLIHNTKDKPKGNVNEIMMMTMIRFFASIIFIAIIIQLLSQFEFNFIAHYFIIYFIFISFEIKISLQKLKKEKRQKLNE